MAPITLRVILLSSLLGIGCGGDVLKPQVTHFVGPVGYCSLAQFFYRDTYWRMQLGPELRGHLAFAVRAMGDSVAEFRSRSQDNTTNLSPGLSAAFRSLDGPDTISAYPGIVSPGRYAGLLRITDRARWYFYVADDTLRGDISFISWPLGWTTEGTNYLADWRDSVATDAGYRGWRLTARIQCRA